MIGGVATAANMWAMRKPRNGWARHAASRGDHDRVCHIERLQNLKTIWPAWRQCASWTHGAIHAGTSAESCITVRLVGSTTMRHHIVRKKKSSAPVGKQASKQIAWQHENASLRRHWDAKVHSNHLIWVACPQCIPNMSIRRYIAASIPARSITSSCVYR